MTKQKLDKNGIKIILCLLVVAIIVVVRLFVPSYTSVRSCTRIGYIGKENKHQWSGSYQSLNGTMTKKLKPENDTLTVTIETESGDLSITIKDMEDQILFVLPRNTLSTACTLSPGSEDCLPPYRLRSSSSVRCVQSKAQ